MTKKVSVHCTASNRAFKLFVRSVVKSVQAYCRLAIASIATEHAMSTSHRERSGLLSRGEVIQYLISVQPPCLCVSVLSTRSGKPKHRGTETRRLHRGTRNSKLFLPAISC